MEQALASKLGITVTTSDPERLRQRMLQFRLKLQRNFGIKKFDDLTFLVNPAQPNTELAILRSTPYVQQITEGDHPPLQG